MKDFSITFGTGTEVVTFIEKNCTSFSEAVMRLEYVGLDFTAVTKVVEFSEKGLLLKIKEINDLKEIRNGYTHPTVRANVIKIIKELELQYNDMCVAAEREVIF